MVIVRNALATLAVLMLPSGPLLGASVDPTFGVNGYAITNLGYRASADRVPRAIAMQGDGRIVAVGSGATATSLRVAAVRFTAGGAPDPTFSGDGVALDVAGSQPRGEAVTFQADGGVLVASTDAGRLSLLRYRPDGTFDASASTYGAAAIPIDPATSAFAPASVQGIAVLGDGRIVVIASVQPLQRISRFFRFTAAGAPDPSLDGTGSRALALPVQDMARASQDRFVLVTGDDLANDTQVIRLDANGAADPSFNGGVPAPVPVSIVGPSRRVVVRPDDRIVVAGITFPANTQSVVVGLTAAGATDTSFAGGSGVATLSFDASGVAVQRMALDAAGRIVVAGGVGATGSQRPFVLRLTGSGGVDGTFNGGAAVTENTATGGVTALAVQADGAILYSPGIAAEFSIRRLAVAGALDVAFGTQGTANVPVSPGTNEIANAMTLQPDGRILVAGETRYSPVGVREPMLVSRQLADGALDPAFGLRFASIGGDTCTLSCPSSAHAILRLANGEILAAGGFQSTGLGLGSGTGSSFAIARFAADGTLLGTKTTSFLFSGFAVARALAVQSTGRFYAIGEAFTPRALGIQGTPRNFAFARYLADGSTDASFQQGGQFQMALGSGDAGANAAAMLPDDRVIAAGYATRPGTGKDFAAIRLSADGTIATGFFDDIGFAQDDIAYAIAIQPDGKVLLAGQAGNGLAVIRFTFEGGLDTSFGVQGRFNATGAPIRAIALQADGRIVALTERWELLRLTASGQLDTTFASGGRFVLPDLPHATARALAIQADGRILAAGGKGEAFPADRDLVVVRVDPLAASPLAVVPTTLDFGGQGLAFTSLPLTASVTNATAAPLAITRTVQLGSTPPVPAIPLFDVTGTCGGLLAAGASCTVTVRYSPQSESPEPAQVVLSTPSGAAAVNLAGAGERSLVAPFYQSILRRLPDSSGKPYWDAEIVRLRTLGADINEAWYAMAQAFFASAEYAAFARDDAGFVTDLYETFLARAPDAPGLAYWAGQLAAGVPREVVLAGFMFSTEFVQFTRAMFGTPVTRTEATMVMDFYRGLLRRLPDTDGFLAWRGAFRAAQCQGATAVAMQARLISQAFLASAEYLASQRSNPQYVGDLYNAFLRRGGDAAGVAFWIDQLATGARDREGVRLAFESSPEFAARVAAVAAEACSP